MSSTAIRPEAARRIRLFSALLWIVGALGIGAITVSTIALAFTANERMARQDPWQQGADVAVASQNGNSWSAPGAARIDLPADLGGKGPLQVTLTASTPDYISLFQSEPGQNPLATSPLYLGMLDSYAPSTVALTQSGTTLWVRSTGAFTVSITPLDTQELTGTVTGAGERYLLYRGTALSATVRQEGKGAMTLEVYSGGGANLALIEGGTFEKRISWDAAPYVVFHITVDRADGSWSITPDVLAGGGG